MGEWHRKIEGQSMSGTHPSLISGLSPKMAWNITIATGLAALAVSLLPGRWAEESFVLLRFATLFYGVTAAVYFLKSHLQTRSESGSPHPASSPANSS